MDKIKHSIIKRIAFNGAADTSIAMATASVDTMLQWLNENDKDQTSAKSTRKSAN